MTIVAVENECLSVAFGVKHVMHMRHIVICSLSGSTIFFHLITNGKVFKKKLLNIKRVFVLHQ